MTMPGHDQLRIGSLEARYHLPPSRFGEKGRLDRILPLAAEEAMAAGLERLGYGGREELCVREIRVPLRLRLSAPDAALALAWGDAMAAAIDDAVRGGEAERALRFPSRRGALADFARGVARGDLRHGWAWTQLGFGAAAGDSGEAPAELARALAADPEALVPILAGIAEEGLLPALARRFESGWWPQLAALALATVGWSKIAFRGSVAAAPAYRDANGSAAAASAAGDGISEATAETATEAARQERRAAAQGSAHPAAAGWRRARLARLLSILRVSESSPLAPALAALALLEADPGRLTATPENEREALLAAAVATLLSPVSPVAPAPPSAAARKEAARGTIPLEGVPAAAPGIAATAEPSSFAPSGEAEGSRVARREGATEWGGLLFLVGLADELGLPEKIAAHPRLASKPHRWSLHRLALQLAPSRPEDPAVLAFAGLLPGDKPPEEEATDEELAVLADFAEMLLQSLAVRLRIPGAGETPVLPGAEPADGDPSRSSSPQWSEPFAEGEAPYRLREDGDPSRSSSPQSSEPFTEGEAPYREPADRDPSRSSSPQWSEFFAEGEAPYRVRGRLARSLRLELLELVCRRRARIVADPGWIEVFFSLDDVKTELRRARLDLDPGFVPWLGVVLRFVYE